MVDSLREFFAEIGQPERSLVLINRSSPDAVRGLLDSLLDNQPVAISERELPAGETDLVALVEDGEMLAQSTLDELLDSILLINSDLYMTGSRTFDTVELPAVLEGLDEIPFRVRGYPTSNKEKLLLITVSRVIERIAAESRGGTLRASFQRLSRIDDERGTRDVYDVVGNTETDVHVYGIDDRGPSEALPVTVHHGSSYEYRKSWFVVFTPETDSGDGEHAALVALEDERNLWDGFWTFRPTLVERIDSYIVKVL